MRIPAVRATLFLFFLFLQTLLNTAETGKVYVANSDSGTVSVIDEATNTVIATPLVGSLPSCLAITPDGSFVYVANTDSNNVSVINTATYTVDTISLAIGSAPKYLAITPNGSFVYVANFDAANVSVIDTATNAVIGAPIPVLGFPLFLAITPDSSFVYVLNGSDQVSVIKTATNTVIATPLVGLGPVFLALTPATTPPPSNSITVGAAVKKAQGLGIRFKYYKLSWNAVPEAAFYTVFRNGFLISKGVDATDFSDTDIDPSMIYVYEIVAYSSSSSSPIASGQVQAGPL